MNDLPALHVEAIHRVVDDGLHNAFTDLIRFRGRFYLTFRACPDGHGVFASSSIRVLVSDDGIGGWREVLSFSVEHRDVRDPHFLVLRDKLFVYTGAWLVPPADTPHDLNDHLGFGAWTDDGEHWHGPQMLEGTYGHYIWRAATHGGTAYLCGRRRRLFQPRPEGDEDRRLHESVMLASDDGLVWRPAALFTEDHGNETAFEFDDRGTVWALARGDGAMPARLCRASPPYQQWERFKLDQNVGGPLLTRWAGHWLVGGRRTTEEHGPRTVLWWLAHNAGDAERWALCEAAELPSGGDNSYPGFVALDDRRGLLSYYSSHEGSGRSVAPCHIYVAELRRG